jgi:hypothetical protein
MMLLLFFGSNLDFSSRILMRIQAHLKITEYGSGSSADMIRDPDLKHSFTE